MTNTATVVGNFFYANPMIQNPLSTTSTSGVVTVIAEPSGAGSTDTSELEFSFPVYNETPVYNNRGMIVKDSRRDYVWDAVGRLTAITNSGVSPSVLTEFTYFADNRRATKKVSKYISGAWAHQHTLQFVWDRWKLMAEVEKAPAGTITSVRQFVYGPDIQGQKTASLDSSAEGIGGLILIKEWTQANGEKIYLALSDALGNVVGLLDGGTGELVAEYEYSPYGQLIMESGPAIASCTLRHRTRYYDSENWLYYYGHRYYDPFTTKFISKDPLGEAGNWNGTQYCLNDPINVYDVKGLMGEGAALNHLAGVIETSVDNTSSPLWAALGSATVDMLRMVAGFDRQHVMQEQLSHSVELMITDGVYGGSNTLTAEAGWQLAEFTPYPDYKRATDSNADGFEQFGGWSGVVGKSALLLAGGIRSGTPTTETVVRPPPLPKPNVTPPVRATGPYRTLRSAGIKDGHHVIQDAAVRDLPGYNKGSAIAVELPGPSTKVGSTHYEATQVQRQSGGGTYGAERRIGYKAMRKAGIPQAQDRSIIRIVDEYFKSIGVKHSTKTRVPGNR